MKSILILNANCVSEGTIQNRDIFIKEGRIKRVGTDLTSLPADQVINAEGRFLLPGMIDDQVHFREPGSPHIANIFSESRAVVAGGITSYMEMPNTHPPTVDRKRIVEKLKIASQHSFANYAFYLGATDDNLEEIKNVNARETCGIKIFMGSSTGSLLVDDPESLERIFAHAPIIIATHCEDNSLIKDNEKIYRQKYGEDIPFSYHPLIRNVEACFKSSSFAIELARRHGTKLHVLHITTADELALFSDLQLEEKHITAEACVHHLFFDDSYYEKKGSLIKCNPAIKTQNDRDAIRQAVIDNKIDVIATDHAPHALEEKKNSYFNAPSGMPLGQHALISLLEHYHAGLFSLELIVEKTSHAVARLFQLEDRGFIREGYWADLVLIDVNKTYTVSEENVLYKCGWSPFTGFTFKSSIDTTIVSGHIAYQKGQVDPNPAGKQLYFTR